MSQSMLNMYISFAGMAFLLVAIGLITTNRSIVEGGAPWVVSIIFYPLFRIHVIGKANVQTRGIKEVTLLSMFHKGIHKMIYS